MSEKWTKGPWILERHDHHSYTLDVANGDECAIGEIYVDWDGEEEGTANAHLVAAAPEMYAMLEALKDEFLYKLSFDETSGIGALADGFGQEINVLLKKACGES